MHLLFVRLADEKCRHLFVGHSLFLPPVLLISLSLSLSLSHSLSRMHARAHTHTHTRTHICRFQLLSGGISRRL